MIKKLFTFLTILILFFTSAQVICANAYDEQETDFNWLYLPKAEKEQKVMEVFKIMFPSGYATNYSKREFQENLKPYLKDTNTDIHYEAIIAGYSHYNDVNLEAFYLGKTKIMYMYALQYKNDLQKTFYYDIMGKLRFIDFKYGDYPNYPFYIKKYTVRGKLVRAMYMMDADTTYIYSEKGEFIGVKHLDTVYGFNFTK